MSKVEHKVKNFLCPYLEAKGWHMFVPYHRSDGGQGYACHGCGEWGG